VTEYRTPWDTGPAPAKPALLPDPPKAPSKPRGRRPAADGATAPAWSSTFTASLELAKQGDVILDQDGSFAPINVCKRPGQTLPETQPTLQTPT